MKKTIEKAIHQLQMGYGTDEVIDSLKQLLNDVDQQDHDLTIAYMAGASRGKKIAQNKNEAQEPYGWIASYDEATEFFYSEEQAEGYCDLESDPFPLYLHPALIKRLTEKEVMDTHHSVGYTKDILKTAEAIQTAFIEKNR